MEENESKYTTKQQFSTQETRTDENVSVTQFEDKTAMESERIDTRQRSEKQYLSRK